MGETTGLEPEKAHDEKLKEYLEGMGYYNIRILPDGMVCNIRFIFTVGVILNPNWSSYEKRYCYENPALAHTAVLEMKTIAEFEANPLQGYTAIK